MEGLPGVSTVDGGERLETSPGVAPETVTGPELVLAHPRERVGAGPRDSVSVTGSTSIYSPCSLDRLKPVLQYFPLLSSRNDKSSGEVAGQS